jgi:hypothetical protein
MQKLLKLLLILGAVSGTLVFADELASSEANNVVNGLAQTVSIYGPSAILIICLFVVERRVYRIYQEAKTGDRTKKYKSHWPVVLFLGTWLFMFSLMSGIIYLHYERTRRPYFVAGVLQGMTDGDKVAHISGSMYLSPSYIGGSQYDYFWRVFIPTTFVGKFPVYLTLQKGCSGSLKRYKLVFLKEDYDQDQIVLRYDRDKDILKVERPDGSIEPIDALAF